MRTLACLAFSLSLTSCGGTDGPASRGKVVASKPALDHSSPKAFVESFFAVVGASDAPGLADFAVPGSVDPEMRIMSELHTAPPEMLKEFFGSFRGGGIVGDIKVSGDHAEVPIVFKKAAGEKRDTLVLKRVDGKWYAASM